uniref:BZIP domain-containing protein n=1 Tax=Panagrolaimus sp. ES5 TaxID=591445 RepID=A0AC34G6N9_9BILA
MPKNFESTLTKGSKINRRRSTSDVIIISDDKARKERNRNASARCRQKKIEKIKELQEETRMLKQQYNMMSREYENSRSGYEIILEKLQQNPIYRHINIQEQSNKLFKIPKTIEPEIEMQKKSSKIVTKVPENKSSEPLHAADEYQNLTNLNCMPQDNALMETSNFNNSSYSASISNDILVTQNEWNCPKVERERPVTLSIIDQKEPYQIKNVTPLFQYYETYAAETPGMIFVSAFFNI